MQTRSISGKGTKSKKESNASKKASDTTEDNMNDSEISATNNSTTKASTTKTSATKANTTATKLNSTAAKATANKSNNAAKPGATKTAKADTTTTVKAKSTPKAMKVTKPAQSPAKSKRLMITETEILKASNDELVEIINELTTTKQDQYFQEYKNEAKATIQDQADTIDNLQNQIESQQRIISRLERQQQDEKNELYISPIRKKKSEMINGKDEIVNKDEISKEFETIGIIFDMLQLLTGLTVINYEEDLHKYYFEIEQNSTSDKFDQIKITYKIVISKNPNENHEINYIPTFLNNPEVAHLRGILPEYFWDKLSFPYHTISQFYTKIAKALNRNTKVSNSQASQ